MRRINESKAGRNTFIALSLIPISGFAMDVFIPSLPDMASHLRATPAAIQLTLSIFMISYGISQFIVGAFIDRYGRFLPHLLALMVFSISSFIIAFSQSLQIIYWMRALEGFTVAVIMVSKRAYFLDMFTGEKLKKYTSLFSVIWAIAPIVAPFLGGFFQIQWGWQSNFLFLGFFGLSFFVIECIMGGESIKTPQPLAMKTIAGNYLTMVKARDFTSGLFVLGLLYGMILIYGMSSPFLIENRLHFSPSVTGYCSLFSGVSMLLGGTISRMMITKPLLRKLIIANLIQMASIAVLMAVTRVYQNLFTLLLYVFIVHTTCGFIFNNLLSYCLMRFPQFAGKASGLVGGGFAVVTSLLSSMIVNTLTINNQMVLGLAYAMPSVIVFILVISTKWKGEKSKGLQLEFKERIMLDENVA